MTAGFGGRGSLCPHPCFAACGFLPVRARHTRAPTYSSSTSRGEAGCRPAPPPTAGGLLHNLRAFTDSANAPRAQRVHSLFTAAKHGEKRKDPYFGKIN